MKKYLNTKNLIVIVVSLVVLHVGVGLAISPMAGSFVVDKINKAAGTKISIASVRVWPLTLSVGLKDLKVFDPQKTDTRIVAVKDFSARLSMLGLLSKRLVFSGISMDGVEVALEGEADGSFNIQKVGKPKTEGAKPPAPLEGIFKKKKDWFSKLYDALKSRFSKEARAKEKQKALEAKKVTKEVAELPRGRLVHFKTGAGRYLVDVKDVAIRDLSVHMKSQDGRELDIEKAVLNAGQVSFDPELGFRLNRLILSAALAKKGTPAGQADIRFSKDTFDVQLKDVDLDAVRFIYEDSLPVDVVKGMVSLDSKTNLANGDIDSRNTLSLKDHEFRPKGPEGLIVEGLNRVNPAQLKFNITGTLDKPEFSGFMKSLMDLAKPGLESGTAAIKGEATKALSGFLGKLNNK